jgi:hypothetical protein
MVLPSAVFGKNEHTKADYFCAEHHSYVVENLVNLDNLYGAGHTRFPVHLGWTGHRGMTGWPVQVIARIPD